MQPVREIFELQALEIIYLTALIGGESFPGLEINLLEEPEAKLRSTMDAQMRTLEFKGYLEIDFMGIAKVNELLRSFIEIGASCESYLCQYVQTNQDVKKTYYFTQDEYRFELEHHPLTNIFRMQEIYGFHEFVFRVIERIPLVESIVIHDNTMEEQMMKQWVEQSLQAGAVMVSLVEVDCRSKESHIIREMMTLIHEGQMWLLQHSSDNEIRRIGLTLSAAMEELCLWLQAA